MRIRTIVFITLLVGFAACKNSGPDRWKQGIVAEAFIYEAEDVAFPSCHAATIAETPDGLVAAWFGGKHERHPEVCIYMSRMTEGQWSKPVSVADGIVSDTLRYATWNPVLYQVPNGELQLYYKVGPNVGRWVGMIKTSKDDGETWSDPVELPDGFLGPVKNRPVLLNDGRLLAASSTEGGAWRVHFEETTDFGKTWNKIGPINGGKEYSVIQPSILVHNDSTLQILCRSKNAVLATSWSYDNGRTWGIIKPSGLPNNNSGTDALTLQDGRHLVVYNHVATAVNAAKGYRTPLNVAVSKDGINWKAALVLEDSEISQYSYPSVIQGKDGMVHIVYTWRRELIKYVKVDPARLDLTSIEDEKWSMN
jgi:alpha-L-rhamnosidase